MDFEGRHFRKARNVTWKWFSVSMLIAILLFLAVAIQNSDGGNMSAQQLLVEQQPLEFGWPFVYATRTWKLTRPLMNEGRYIFLEPGSINGVEVATTEVSYWVLLANALIGTSVIVGSLLCLRQLASIKGVRFRFSIRGMFAAVAFCATLVWLKKGMALQDVAYYCSDVILLLATGLAWYEVFGLFVPKKN